MKEWEEEVLKQYDLDIKNVKRVRNGLLCEEDTGVFLLENTAISERRLNMLMELKERLKKIGFTNTDRIIPNKEGKAYCELEDGSKYILKHWFTGHECDVKKENEILQATNNLACLHNVLQKDVSLEGELPSCGEDMRQKFFRHNRELKKVRSFIRQKVDKGYFEAAFLKNFDSMYAWAEVALDRLEKSNYENMERQLIHGDYNYHNLWILQDGIATTNFEHFEYNIPMMDFYYFLRKAMEKNRWDVKLGDKMIECYQKAFPLSKEKIDFVGVCIAYPEKFWKTANSYARSKKSWIPAKNLEKLELVVKQTEEKRIFLEKVFDFHL